MVCGLDIVSAGSALVVRGHKGPRRGNLVSFVRPKKLGAACKRTLEVTSAKAVASGRWLHVVNPKI